jgi:hypothetical protein
VTPATGKAMRFLEALSREEKSNLL